MKDIKKLTLEEVRSLMTEENKKNLQEADIHNLLTYKLDCLTPGEIKYLQLQLDFLLVLSKNDIEENKKQVQNFTISHIQS